MLNKHLHMYEVLKYFLRDLQFYYKNMILFEYEVYRKEVRFEIQFLKNLGIRCHDQTLHAKKLLNTRIK